MINFRPYQDGAIERVAKYFFVEGKTGNPLIALPTGTGKSLVAAGFTQRLLHYYPSNRLILGTHVKELVKQNANKLRELWPSAPLGIYSAGLKEKISSLPIIYGGVQSMVNAPHLFGHRDFLLIDEAHLVSPKDGTRWLTFIDALREVNPKLKVIGMTATMYRTQQGELTAGGGLFTDVCYDMCNPEGFRYFIANGWMAPLVTRPTHTEIDLSSVKKVGEDYNQKQLQEASDREDINFAALNETCQRAYDRRSWLIFTSGVEHSEHVAEMLRTRFGVSALAVHSRLDPDERDKRIAAYQNGEIRCIVNYGILTTGFDDPKTDLIVMLRATMSASLWVQMLGRGTRPCPGKLNCLVLDFARNAPRLGPIDDPVIPKSRKPGPPGDAPVKLCDSCGTYNHPRAPECVFCGAPFEFRETLTQQPGEVSVMSMEDDVPVVDVLRVDSVFYSKHIAKASGLPTLRVDYMSGLNRYTEYVNFEHSGYPRHLANEWWRQRHNLEPPDTVDQALSVQSELAVPPKIRVWLNKRHNGKVRPEILGYEA